RLLTSPNKHAGFVVARTAAIHPSFGGVSPAALASEGERLPGATARPRDCFTSVCTASALVATAIRTAAPRPSGTAVVAVATRLTAATHAERLRPPATHASRGSCQERKRRS